MSTSIRCIDYSGRSDCRQLKDEGLPIKIIAGIYIFLFFLICNIGYSEEGRIGTASGQILDKDGRPISNAAVIFFNTETGPPPGPGNYWRIPDFGCRVDNDGRFTASLLEGSYYIGVIKRPSEEKDGQPIAEDWLFIGKDERNILKRYFVKEGRVLDLGILYGNAFKTSSADQEGVSVIEGIVYDDKGTPVKDAVVEAFLKRTELRRPVFSSGKSGPDGKYVIKILEGTYYLRVRPRFPSVSNYKAKELLTVTVRKGEARKEVDINVVYIERSDARTNQ